MPEILDLGAGMSSILLGTLGIRVPPVVDIRRPDRY
jgi:hypothetical protein